MSASPMAAALAAFQADLPVVQKNHTNPHFRNRYADLADMSKVILPALAKQGLSWTTRPTIDEFGRFALAYELRHAEGERLDGLYPLPSPEGANQQQLGSAITYARRYALAAVTGVAADDDDDGQAAASAPAAHTATDGGSRPSTRRPPMAGSKPSSDAQHKLVWKLVRDSGVTLDELKAMVGRVNPAAESPRQLTSQECGALIDALKEQPVPVGSRGLPDDAPRHPAANADDVFTPEEATT